MILDDLESEEKPVVLNVVRDLRSCLLGVMSPGLVDGIIAQSVRNSHDA